jgi:C4-dicarboxylate transporter
MDILIGLIIVIGVALFIIKRKKPEWLKLIKNKILGE